MSLRYLLCDHHQTTYQSNLAIRLKKTSQLKPIRVIIAQITPVLNFLQYLYTHPQLKFLTYLMLAKTN